MSSLITDTHFSDPDAFYAALANAHRDRSEGESAAINARLILLLANHIGEQSILEQALAIASQLTREDSTA